MPLYTPLGGSWLNMAESMQPILFQRGLVGQDPEQQLKLFFVRSGCRAGTTIQHLSSGVGSVRLVVNAAGSVDTLLAVPVHTLAVQYIEEQPCSTNGNAHAKRPTRTFSGTIYSGVISKRVKVGKDVKSWLASLGLARLSRFLTRSFSVSLRIDLYSANSPS